MEEILKQLAPTLESKLTPIVEAIEKVDATSKEYLDLLAAFNSTMVVYSQIQELFIRKALSKKEEEN